MTLPQCSLSLRCDIYTSIHAEAFTGIHYDLSLLIDTKYLTQFILAISMIQCFLYSHAFPRTSKRKYLVQGMLLALALGAMPGYSF
jgi:hypothetical protein